MDIKKNICIVIRGELLRNSKSFFYSTKSEEIKKYDLSEESFKKQDDIMKSIINHIVIPYKNIGYNVFISGCIYNCEEYNNNLISFFPNNTILKIKPGKTNAAEMYYKSINHAEKKHPDCIEYISIRGDYLMLKNIIIKNIIGKCVGYAWVNKKFPNVDVFFIISKKTINILKKILYNLANRHTRVCTHGILNQLRNNKVNIYAIWNDYNNQRTGISYSDYINNIKIHKNRPFVNYMRNLDK